MVKVAAAALVAVPWVVWAVVRCLGLERGYPAVPAMAFTPYVAATAWIPVALALVLRRRAVAVVAVLAAALLAAAVVPRALHGAQDPLPGGRGLSLMTANLRYGMGDARAVMALTRTHDVDVLSVQELTPAAVARLAAAGATARFPYRVLEPRRGAGGSGLYSRFPLHRLREAPTTHAMPEAWLELPGVAALLVKDVHTRPPLRGFVGVWQHELRSLPRAAADGSLRLLLGDFNATLDQRDLRALIDSGYADAANAAGIGLHGTFVVRNHPTLTIAIDHALVDRRMRVTAAEVEALPGSDHRALLVRVSVPVPQWRRAGT